MNSIFLITDYTSQNVSLRPRCNASNPFCACDGNDVEEEKIGGKKNYLILKINTQQVCRAILCSRFISQNSWFKFSQILQVNSEKNANLHLNHPARFDFTENRMRRICPGRLYCVVKSLL